MGLKNKYMFEIACIPCIADSDTTHGTSACKCQEGYWSAERKDATTRCAYVPYQLSIRVIDSTI